MYCVADIKYKFIIIIRAKDVSKIYMIPPKKEVLIQRFFFCISTRLMRNFLNDVRNNFMFRL